MFSMISQKRWLPRLITPYAGSDHRFRGSGTGARWSRRYATGALTHHRERHHVPGAEGCRGELRLRERASQAVFARYLNVTTGLMSQWERGEKPPRGASLKLLTLVAKNGLGAVA